jgi:hypothetical protein
MEKGYWRNWFEKNYLKVVSGLIIKGLVCLSMNANAPSSNSYEDIYSSEKVIVEELNPNYKTIESFLDEK